MKKFVMMLLVVLLVAPVMFVATGCWKKEKPIITLVDISVDSLDGVCNEYLTGEQLNVDGLKIKANYSDNSFDLLDVEKDWVSGNVLDTDKNFKVGLSGEQILKITYEGKVTTYTVQVFAGEHTGEFLGLTITQPPFKTEYAMGQMFNPFGMIVVANYTDGSNAITNYSIEKTTALETGDTTITISYTNFNVTHEASVSITVLTVEEYIKGLINSVIANIEYSGEPAWWDIVIDDGAILFYDSLTATNKANFTDEEVLKLLDIFDTILYSDVIYDDPFALVSMFYCAGIANTKISNFVWYFAESVNYILDAAVNEGFVNAEDKIFYDEIMNLGKQQFITIFNAALELGQLSQSIFDIFGMIMSVDNVDGPSLNEFRDIILAIKADAISALTIIDGNVINALGAIAKIFVPMPGTPENELCKVLIDEYCAIYPVLWAADLAILNAIDNAMIQDVYNFIMSESLTEDDIINFIQGIATKFINAVVTADIGDSDFAVAYKAYYRLYMTTMNIQAIIMDVYYLDEIPSLGEFKNIFLGLKDEALEALDILSPATMETFGRLLKHYVSVFVPNFVPATEANIVFALVDEFFDSNTYPTIHTALLAMINAIDDTMIEDVYDNAVWVEGMTAQQEIEFYQGQMKLLQRVVDELADAALSASYESSDFATVFKAALEFAKSYSKIATTIAFLNAEAYDYDAHKWVNYEPTEQEWLDALVLIRDEVVNVLVALDPEVFDAVLNYVDGFMSCFDEIVQVGSIANLMNEAIEFFRENADIYATLRGAAIAGLGVIDETMLGEMYNNYLNAAEANKNAPYKTAKVFNDSEFIIQEHIFIEVESGPYWKAFVTLYENENTVYINGNHFYLIEDGGDYIILGDWSRYTNGAGYGEELRYEQDKITRNKAYCIEVGYFEGWDFFENGKYYRAIYVDNEGRNYFFEYTYYVVLDYGVDYIVLVSNWEYWDHQHYNFNLLDIITPAMANTIIDAILDADLGNEPFAVTLKAFLQLGKIMNNSNGLVDLINSSGGEQLDIADAKQILSGAKQDLLDMLDVLDETTVNAMGDLVKRFLPYFMTDTTVYEQQIDKFVGYYPALKNVLTAMINEFDPNSPSYNMVDVLYDYIDAMDNTGEVTDDFIIALAKIFNAGFTATDGIDEATAAEIIVWIVEDLRGGIMPAEVFGTLSLTDFIDALYADTAEIAGLGYGTTLGEYDENIWVILVKGMFEPYETVAVGMSA